MSATSKKSNDENLSFEAVHLNFEKMNGLVPCIVQHAFSREVLMVGFMNEEAWQKSCETGIVTIYRRTLGRVWQLNEDKGQLVRITRVKVDCDDDTVLFETVPEHPVCGHGYLTCFCREIPAEVEHH